MNPTHIIMCSPPAMNLPAHDTIKHLLVQVSHHIIQNASKKSYFLQRYRLTLPKCHQAILLRSSPGGSILPPGAKRSRDVHDSPIVWRPALCRQTLYH